MKVEEQDLGKADFAHRSACIAEKWWLALRNYRRG